LLDYWPLRRFGPETPRGGPAGRPAAGVVRLLAEKLPLVALSVASCWVTVRAQEAAIKPLESLPLSARLANAVVAYAVYLGKTLWPANLAVFYPRPRGSYSLGVVAAALVLAAVTALAARLGRRYPAVLVGWCWFLGTLVPVIGIVQVGDQ